MKPIPPQLADAPLPVPAAPEYAGKAYRLDRQGLEALIQLFRARGYRVIGPTVREKVVLLDEIESVDDLPEGWTDEQEGGTYRLKRREDKALFGFAAGPRSWKQFLFPPERRLWRAERSETGFQILPDIPAPRKTVFFGVRPCELAAIAIQDKVFMGGRYVDAVYKARRENALIVVANCGEPGGTCFCASMGTGPKAAGGFDLALTEVMEAGEGVYMLEAGSEEGFGLFREIHHKVAQPDVQAAAAEALRRAEGRMGRNLDTDDIQELLERNLEHPRWEAVARRCLTCANCTMVCPTCFCHTVEDSTDLTGTKAERRRRWDSCFNVEFSYISGGSIRTSAMARYRQWMTHKLGTWIDQYGTSGCVGCGRCITWCPVGIDLTEETDAIRQSELASRTSGSRKGRTP